MYAASFECVQRYTFIYIFSQADHTIICRNKEQFSESRSSLTFHICAILNITSASARKDHTLCIRRIASGVLAEAGSSWRPELWGAAVPNISWSSVGTGAASSARSLEDSGQEMSCISKWTVTRQHISEWNCAVWRGHKGVYVTPHLESCRSLATAFAPSELPSFCSKTWHGLRNPAWYAPRFLKGASANRRISPHRTARKEASHRCKNDNK